MLRRRRLVTSAPPQPSLLKGLLLLLAGLVLLPSPAFAAPPGPDALPVHVVNVKSLNALDQAEALTGALKKAVRVADGWSLGDTNQALEFLALQMKCADPIDAACEARIADVIKADRYLWSEIDFEQGGKTNVVGKLNFFVRGKGTTSADLRYSANLTDPNDDFLIEVAKQAFDEVTGGPPQGTLKISTGGVAGQVFIDDEPVGAIGPEGASYPLPSGEHRVVVKAPGYEDAEATTKVKPATTVETTLTLVQAEVEKPVDIRMIAGFGMIGVGAATGAVGLWSALKINGYNSDPTYESFRAATYNNLGNACDAARDGQPDQQYNVSDPNRAQTTTTAAGEVASLCDQAAIFEILQAVMFPVAGVSAGVGVYLLGTSSLFGGDDESGDELSAWSVTPIVTPGLQAVSVTYSF
ncbi:MAG: PEGA domain-containing protein [Myxococcales bacterium]|nr:PEGA domain-containing protein [Myxococcales bacterium]